MNFHLTPELKTLQTKVRAFVEEELMPLEVEVEMAGGDLPHETYKALKQRAVELELNGMSLPKEVGGQGYSAVEQVAIHEELGKVTNGLWVVAFSPAMCLVAATPDQVERYVRPACEGKRRDAYAVTEPGAGSDPSTLETRAVRDGDEWVINGEKWHVTGGDLADFLIVQADTEHGHTLFLVDMDAPGLETIDDPKYMHNWIEGHLKLRFHDVRVPDDDVLGEVGRGMELTKDWFRRERLMIAARCVGAAQRLIDEAGTFAQERVQFGSPISEYQAIQFMLADSITEMWSARLMTYAAAQAEDEVTDAESLKLSHARTSMAKLYASEMAGRVADRAVQIFGGRGYMRENVAERFYRELRVDRIWEGTSEIQRLIIARSLVKRGIEVHL